ncbi:hypothetical protein GOV10_05905 [Candidatus Woesearchaeota archaeon]|nr:hypothetical protein [Candidatus Woesearchaeota archaeon]
MPKARRKDASKVALKAKKPLVLFFMTNMQGKDLLKFDAKAHKKWHQCIASRKFFFDLGSELKANGYQVATGASHDLSEADHIVFFDVWSLEPRFKEYLKRRKDLHARVSVMVIEPPITNSFIHKTTTQNLFDRVLTFDPNITDNKKFFLYHYPTNVFSPNPFKVPFTKKRFLCVTGGNKFSVDERELYSERKKGALFFEKKPEGIHLYGGGWNKKGNLHRAIFHLLFRWKTVMSQVFRGEFKRLIYVFETVFNTRKVLKKTYQGFKKESVVEIYSQYKFSLCFENGTKIPGYASERLYDCMNARCVPVYWGDDAIIKQVPKGCFIDMRKFKDYESLYRFLKKIDEKKYKTYIKNINAYLKTAEGKPYSLSHFAKEFYKGLIKD